MPRLQEKKAKLGRNDPCWCGSGKKYKDCHSPIEQTQRAEYLRLRQAQDTLIPKIIEAAQSVPELFPGAFERFWQGKYTPEQVGELDDLEERGAERFLIWFAFDHTQDGGPTLVEKLVQVADHGGFEVDEFEYRLLRFWKGVRLRPYIVEQVHKGQGLTLRDLLDQGLYEVSDNAASKRLSPGEIMVGHLVPVGGKAMITPAEAIDPPIGRSIDDDPSYYLAGAAAQLTGDTAEKLVEFAGLYLEDLRRTQPDATWSDLLRCRSYVLNHFVMALPQQAPDPTIIDDVMLRTRVALQLTGASLAGLVGRGKPAEELEPSEDRIDEPTSPVT